jgi:hypothetical protein
MRTEDDIARDLRNGTITIEQAIVEFQGDDVLVYSPIETDDATVDWDQVESAATNTSGLFAALRKVGASETQMDTIGAHIERLRVQGRTFP